MEHGNQKQVLVIDDDPVYRELLTMALTGEGYRTLLAENGENAKSILGREPVDGIIVDMLMPIMDGLRFLRWLRNDEKNGVPTLVLTSLDNRGVSVEALVAGATDVIIKPVSLPVLLKKLSALMSAQS